MLDNHPHGCIGFVGRLTAQHLEEDHSKGIDVRTPVDRLALGLLRAHVGGCADDGAAGRASLGFGEFDDTKIRNVGFVKPVEKDVARLQVAVDDSFGVCLVQTWGEALNDPGCLLDRYRALADAVGKRAAGHVAHDEIRLAVFLAEVVDRHDGRVLQHSDGFGLAFETNAELRIMEHFARQDFDRHLALEARVVSLIDGCHATAAKLGFDFITSNLLWIHTI